MLVNCIKCPLCKDIIYSRAHYDFHWCSCRNLFIDGGADYCRYGGNNLEKIQPFKRKLNVTKEELYEDWNTGQQKYGTIHEKKKEKSSKVKIKHVVKS